MIVAFVPFIDFVLKIFLYYFALKFRKLDPRLLTCALCAGASSLTALMPLPEMLHVMLTIVVAGYFIVRNTDTEIYPNGIFIPLVIEVVDAIALRYAVMPLIS